MKRFLILFFTSAALALAQVTIDAVDVKGTLTGVTLSDAAGADPNFTLVVIPDSQMLTETAEAAPVLNAQMQWAVDNKLVENVRAVIGVGDITNTPSAERIARGVTAYNLAKAASIPVVPILGNHDYDASNPQPRLTTAFDAAFGPAYFTGLSYYGASSYPGSSNANYYITFTNGSQTYIVLAMEFYPRPGAVSWAQGIIAANPSAYIILTTHGYLNTRGTRSLDGDDYGPAAYGLPGADYNAEELYNAVVKPYSNVRLVLSGHFLGTTAARETTISQTTGAVTHHLFTNYQLEAPANHRMLIMRFKPALGVVSLSYYSPSLGAEDPAQPSIDLPYQPVRVQDSIAVNTDLFAGRDVVAKRRLTVGSGSIPYRVHADENGNLLIGTDDYTGLSGGGQLKVGRGIYSTGGTNTLGATTFNGANTFSGSANTFNGGTANFSAPSLTHVLLGTRFTLIGGSSFHLANNSYYGIPDGQYRSYVPAVGVKAVLDSGGNFRIQSAPATAGPNEVQTYSDAFTVTADGAGWLRGNLLFDAAKGIQGPSGTSGFYPEDNVQGAKVVTPGGFEVYVANIVKALDIDGVGSVELGNSAGGSTTTIHGKAESALVRPLTVRNNSVTGGGAGSGVGVSFITHSGLLVGNIDVVNDIPGSSTITFGTYQQENVFKLRGSQLQAAAGAGSAPAYSFQTNTTVGMYYDGPSGIGLSGHIAGVELTESPAAPAANGFRIYAKDNGAGKTVLYVRFSSGAEQQIAIEP